MFDLPVETSDNRRNYRRFVDKLEDNGFVRIQYSIFVRPSATVENTEVHTQRILNALPPDGEVRIIRLTDRQWARTLIFRAAKPLFAEAPPEQFAFFDEEMNPTVEYAEPKGEVELQEHVVLSKLVAETKSDYRVANPSQGPSRKKKRTKRQTAKSANLKFDFFDE
ncbi:MAG: CRISPR-associated endonuclease Cas2 [Armatimonadetes bacterium]|nr:CRISPR-associated endonuclease Cas2 [Armatimonadota bacterium]